MKPKSFGSWGRVWGAGSCAALAAFLPASAGAAQLGGVPANDMPGNVYTIDFSIEGGHEVPGAYPTIDIPRFGPNDFSELGGTEGGFSLSYELLMVQVQFTTHFSANMLAENQSSVTGATYTYDLPLTSTFLYPDSGSTAVVATITSTGQAAITLSTYDGTWDYSGDSGYGAGGEGADSASNSSSLFVVAPPNLGSYTGAGTWAVNVNSAVGTHSFLPTENFKAGYEGPEVWVTTRVIYTYAMIPESSTVIAAASLLGLLGASRWRSARRAAAK